MKHRITHVQLAILTAGFLLLIMTTSPVEAPLGLLVIPYILVGLFVFVILRRLLHRFIGQRVGVVSGLLAGAVVVLLSLVSVGQLGSAEVAITALIVAIGVWYSGRI